MSDSNSLPPHLLDALLTLDLRLNLNNTMDGYYYYQSQGNNQSSSQQGQQTQTQTQTQTQAQICMGCSTIRLRYNQTGDASLYEYFGKACAYQHEWCDGIPKKS